jgi:hypothetical protein
MTTPDTKALRIALIAIGAIFVIGVFPLMTFWPAGFAWEPRQSEYEQMILSFLVVLGIFLLLAARDPLQHLSLIWFAAWSSLVHGLVMLVQAIVDPAERTNLLGDVPALIIIGVVLMVLTPRKSQLARPSAGS